MKAHELQTLPGVLSKDFRTIEPHLQALDKHLVLRSHVSGYGLGDLETKIWQTLKANRAAMGFIRKGGLANLTRWFVYIEQAYPEIQTESNAVVAAQKAKVAAASKAGAAYNISLQEAEKGVVTRFLPEPSGYLHIGHAKAALLCDYFAKLYNGKMFLRLDDTNPSKEKEEFQDAIIEDLRLMGIEPAPHPNPADPDKPIPVTYTSDYFDYLYDMCIRMITEGHAYADDTDMETMREERLNSLPSKRRDRSVEENLRIFQEMKIASEEGLRNCIRAKISYNSPNGALRDPVIYRCNVDDAHHRTGRTWNMYPTYDFACPLIDSLEGVTHAMRSIEYTDRHPQYHWFQKTLKLRKVYIWDFARMNFIRTFLSKRKLAKLVDSGFVWGWDDPRFPTIRGIRRRGMTIPALRDFILKQGPSRNIVTMDWTSFWTANKKEIDPVVPRHTAVSQTGAVKVTLTGAEVPAKPFQEDRPKHAKNPAAGLKKVTFSSQIIFDQADVKSFAPNEELTLMAWGNAILRSKEGTDPITSATMELNLKGDFRATDKKVTWLSTDGTTLVPAELWDFDYLITKDKLEEDDKVEDFLNPNTASMEKAWCDEGVASLKKDDIIQLERRGYYRVDKGLSDWTDGSEGPEGKRVVMFCIPTGKTK